MDQQPIKPQNDHDLLIVLCTKMEGIEKALTDIKNGTVTVQADHENRLRILEKSQDILFGKILGASAIVSIVVVIVSAIIQGILK